VNYYQLLSLERPEGLVGEPSHYEDMTYMLPSKAQDKGMLLLDITYRQPEYSSKDPVILFDREGRILHMWPDNYVPGYFEVRKVCEKLLGR